MVRLRVVAPAPLPTQSTSDSISAFWPGASIAGSAAAAQYEGSDPVELPGERPDTRATQVSAVSLHQTRKRPTVKPVVQARCPLLWPTLLITHQTPVSLLLS